MTRSLLLLALMLTASASSAQSADSLGVTVLTRDGQPATLADVVRAMAEADAVFLGEQHDDSLGHAVQHHLLRAAHQAYGGQRLVALGMEMFETDVQPVLDEYAAGLIRERDFLDAARPWGNYARDYRPMVEYAIENAIPVVGTNAPKRYVSRVSREGDLGGLAGVPDAGRATMPLAIAPPSEATATAFRSLMESMNASHGGGTAMPGMPTVDGLLAAQNLRDATMAWAFADALSATTGVLGIHLNGAFHSDGGRGIPEHLARLRPGARILTVTIGPNAEPGEDDFAIVTR